MQADTVLATSIQGNASICSLACRSNPRCNVFNYCAVPSNCTAMGLTFNQCQIGFSNVVAAYAPTPNVTASGAGMISGESRMLPRRNAHRVCLASPGGSLAWPAAWHGPLV